MSPPQYIYSKRWVAIFLKVSVPTIWASVCFYGVFFALFYRSLTLQSQICWKKDISSIVIGSVQNGLIEAQIWPRIRIIFQLFMCCTLPAIHSQISFILLLRWAGDVFVRKRSMVLRAVSLTKYNPKTQIFFATALVFEKHSDTFLGVFRNFRPRFNYPLPSPDARPPFGHWSTTIRFLIFHLGTLYFRPRQQIG